MSMIQRNKNFVALTKITVRIAYKTVTTLEEFNNGI